MVAINLGQIVVLNAQLHHITQIIFAGGFVQNNPFMKKIWNLVLAIGPPDKCKPAF